MWTEKLTSINLWATIDILLSSAPVSIDTLPMAVYGRAASGILVKIDVCRQEFRVAALNAVYFGNRTSKGGRMCLSGGSKIGLNWSHLIIYKRQKTMNWLTRWTKHSATNSVVDMQFSRSFKNTSLWNVYNSLRLPNSTSSLPCSPGGTNVAISSDLIWSR